MIIDHADPETEATQALPDEFAEALLAMPLWELADLANTVAQTFIDLAEAVEGVDVYALDEDEFQAIAEAWEAAMSLQQEDFGPEFVRLDIDGGPGKWMN